MNNKAYHFKAAMLVVVVSVFVFSAAFFTENNGATGLVVSQEDSLPKPFVILLNNPNSMSQLSSGNYHIDQNANVLWIDDPSRPVVARLQSYNQEELDRSVYVSIEGEVFFVR